MNIQMLAFLTVFLTLFAGLNFYIGWRGWQAFGRLIPTGYGAVYWIAFALLAFSYLLGRIGNKYLPESLSVGFSVTGAYWLAAMDFFVLSLVAIDLVRLANRWLHFLPREAQYLPPITGLAVVLLVAGIVGYGAWNSRHPRLTHYDITINKPASGLKELHAVMVSDIHLGNIIHNGRLIAMTDQVNSLNPDIILLPGDIIDENIGPFVEQRMPDTFRRLKARYGIYAVFGNHEYIGGHADEAQDLLQEAGVTVLRDEVREVAGSFYVAGRDDRSKTRFGGTGRKQLSEVLAGIDQSLPLILLDHQPSQLAEARSMGVDLQLSGHTHRGQLFPFNLVTRRVFDTDWGYLRQGDYQILVSCGFGTWGPPIRIGNHPEIVDLTIRFQIAP
ncbi:MAG: putative metallophosphoesterase [Pelotomaculum sp. PtaB.Bin104]|nr:MAG: putative metallophosphoesterase [Pelotomaculum sp. PtaB.Bin104]